MKVAWLSCALALAGCGSAFAAGDPPVDAGDELELEAAAVDVVDEHLVDAGDPPVDAGDELELEAAAVDAAPLCCWIAWTANGGCCPAPGDPSCAYACDRTGHCTAGAASCSAGGCFGSVDACP